MTYLLSRLYELAIRVWAFLFRIGWLQRHQLSCPVISIGNLTLGGTGKTPFVAYLAKVLLQLGYKPSIISRGYKGKMEKQGGLVSDGIRTLVDVESCGDEPYMLAQALKGVPIAVNRDRFAAGKALEKKFGGIVHILDDGFQHLRLRRNLNVLLIDGTDPFGNGHLIPKGKLREPVSAIARADLVIITRGHLTTDGDDIERQVRKHHPSVSISYFYHDAIDVRDLASRESLSLRTFANSRVVTLAGIGNPAILLRDLAHYQIKVVDQFFFRDHHKFTQQELDIALTRSRELGARCILTTEKDAVRLKKLSFRKGEVAVFEIEIRPENLEGYLDVWRKEMENLPDPH
jgi:tetraacyldisaccharide 4'-kinase